MQSGLGDDFLHAWLDHPAWCESCLQIRDKGGVTVPLRLSPSQRRLNQAIERAERLGKPVRVVILKSRQVHMSVGVASEFFHRAPFLPGRHCYVVAHREKNARDIMDYYAQFTRGYRPFQHGEVSIELPKLVAPRKLEAITNATERIEWGNGSYIQSATAGSPEAGRSFSGFYIHLSELAFYTDAHTFLAGLMQTVPNVFGSMVIAESTANGVGGPFYELWQKANDSSNSGWWIPVFFAYHEHPEYCMPVEGSLSTFQARLSNEERQLQQQFNLTLEQLNWRRWCIDTNCRGSVEVFHQEYPATPEEAFLTSGRPRFCQVALSRQPLIREPLAGALEVRRVGTRDQIQFVPREDGKGELQVWKPPVQNKLYVIGADPSRGIDASGDRMGVSDPDYSVAHVLDQDTGEQVASLAERLTPMIFARYVADLARWYNDAFLIPEANELGFIQELLNQYPLGLIYQRQREADDRRSGSLHEYGWLTTTRTKPQLIHALDAALRDFSVVVRKPRTLQELRTFVYRPDGKMEAQDGCHDDEVIALALAVIGLRTAPRDRRMGVQGFEQVKPEGVVRYRELARRN